MPSRYYETFPPVPVAVVAGAAAACQVPGIVDARACRDNSVIMEISQDEGGQWCGWSLTLQHLVDLADFFEVAPEDVGVVQGSNVIVLTFLDTCFDFAAQFEQSGSNRARTAREFGESFDQVDCGR